MHKITFSDRLRYQFDQTMSKGTIALIGWLALLSVILIGLISLIVVVTGVAPTDETGNQPGFVQVAWMGLMRTLDAGTMGGDTGSWPFLLAMFAVTLGGVFIVSSLIGILTSGLEGKLEELRKGRSFVVEEDHTVILGWSPQIFSIISELVVANANQKRRCIAILAAEDKVTMEDEIRNRVPELGTTHVVCRTGSPIDPNDLEIINPHGARSIIILSPETEDPDSQVVKTLLALLNAANRRPQPYHIVAEIREQPNAAIARMVGKKEVEVILTADLIARIAVQTTLQPGLAAAYTELLDFAGDEVYFKAEPALVGKTFGEALLAYEDSAVIGLQYATGQVQLNPPMATVIQPGDQIIAISEDDDTIRLSGLTDLKIEPAAIRAPAPGVHPPQRILILGWNQRVPFIIQQLDAYVPPESTLTVVADVDEATARAACQCERLVNQTVTFRRGDTTDRQQLDRLAVTSYHHVLVLSYDGTLPPQEADARTLITLLHLRDIAEKDGHTFSIVSEMLDLRNRELAEVTQADDFIVSDKLVSLMLSQISENKALVAVFDDLFDPAGSELYLKPVEEYVTPGHPLNFYTVVEAGRQRGQVVVGYKIQAESWDKDKNHGVRLNPDKSAPITFAPGDQLIVLAEE